MIEVKGLTKEFGRFRAVDKVSFTVPKGQILGFLGPNGAGKSTTMKMITGFIEPTAGSISVGEFDVASQSLAAREQIGYLPESAPSYGEMTVVEFLSFIAEVRGLRGANMKAALNRMADTCFLQDVWYQPIETLSKGYRQRVGFAQALIHDPPVLILDEPTDGLDPNQKHEVRELIRSMAGEKTIVLSTHILEEVEAVCERVVIIAEGEVVSDASPAELMQQSRFHNAVSLQVPSDHVEKVKAKLASIKNVDSIEDLPDHKGVRVFPRNGATIVSTISDLSRTEKWPVEQLHVEPGRLDEVFRKVTRGRSDRASQKTSSMEEAK